MFARNDLNRRPWPENCSYRIAHEWNTQDNDLDAAATLLKGDVISSFTR